MSRDCSTPESTVDKAGGPMDPDRKPAIAEFITGCCGQEALGDQITRVQGNVG